MATEQRWIDMAYRICGINGHELVNKPGLITSLAESLAAAYNEGHHSRDVEVKALETKIEQLHAAGNEFLGWYMGRRGETLALNDLRTALGNVASSTEQAVPNGN